MLRGKRRTRGMLGSGVFLWLARLALTPQCHLSRDGASVLGMTGPTGCRGRGMGLGAREHSESLTPVKETPAQQHIEVSPPHVLLVHTTHSDGHTLDTWLQNRGDLASPPGPLLAISTLELLRKPDSEHNGLLGTRTISSWSVSSTLSWDPYALSIRRGRY